MAVWLILPVAALATIGTTSEPTSPPSEMSWEERCASLYPLAGKVPQEFAECVSKSGPVATVTIGFELGFSPGELSAALHEDLGELDSIWVSSKPVDLKWNFRGGGYLFDDVGGMSQTVTIFSMGIDRRLDFVQFAWQNRPLNLDEALLKAKGLQAKLKRQGFEDVAQHAFAVTDKHGAPQSQTASGWVDAAAQLRSEAQSISYMTLFSMRNRGSEVKVTLENRRREDLEFAKGIPDLLPAEPGYNRSFYEGAGGYEWHLNIELARSE